MTKNTATRTEKRCPRCTRVLPLTEFGLDRSRANNVTAYCRPCMRAAYRDWQARSDPTGERKRGHYKRWLAKNHEVDRIRHRDRMRRMALERPEHVTARRKKWEAANREHLRVMGAMKESRRRARLRGVLTLSFTPEQLHQRLSMFGHLCWVCRGPWDSVDHVKPIRHGGAHILANLRPICRSCNARKGAKWPYPP